MRLTAKSHLYSQPTRTRSHLKNSDKIYLEVLHEAVLCLEIVAPNQGFCQTRKLSITVPVIVKELQLNKKNFTKKNVVRKNSENIEQQRSDKIYELSSIYDTLSVIFIIGHFK